MVKRLEDDLPEGEMVELEDVDNDVEDTEDGGAKVRIADDKDEKESLEHFANIVDEVDQGMLEDAVTDLVDKIEKDKEARKKRDKLYEEGLRRTGLGDDAPGGAQFSGSTKVVHPMLVEACVDFSARVMKEIFPPNGPVRSKVIGERDKEKVDKAERKVEFMNWQTTEQMPEFRGELEQLSTQLPLGGAQYLKMMWNPQYRRPSSEFIAIDDIYLPLLLLNSTPLSARPTCSTSPRVSTPGGLKPACTWMLSWDHRACLSLVVLQGLTTRSKGGRIRPTTRTDCARCLKSTHTWTLAMARSPTS